MNIGFAARATQPVVVTTVVTPATSSDLTTLTAVKDELGLSTNAADAVLQRYISASSIAAAQFCNRPLVMETVSDVFYPPRDSVFPSLDEGQTMLQLTRWPAISVASVTEDGQVLIAGTDYLVRGDAAQVVRLDSVGSPTRWRAQEVAVIYDGGFAPAAIPPDVADAIIEWVKFRYFARMRDPALKSEQIDGIARFEYLWGSGPGGPGDMPAAVAAKLERYRVPVIV